MSNKQLTPELEKADTWHTIYPERRNVSAAWIIGQAKDAIATDYMKRNPEADEAAIEENSRVRSVEEAIEILEDQGLVTVGRPR